MYYKIHFLIVCMFWKRFLFHSMLNKHRVLCLVGVVLHGISLCRNIRRAIWLCLHVYNKSWCNAFILNYRIWTILVSHVFNMEATLRFCFCVHVSSYGTTRKAYCYTEHCGSHDVYLFTWLCKRLSFIRLVCPRKDQDVHFDSYSQWVERIVSLIRWDIMYCVPRKVSVLSIVSLVRWV